MNRRQFIQTAIAATAAGATAEAMQTVAPHPNILFILADDLGYGDLSCYGRPDYMTPALDGMAKRGLRFTDNYAAASVCTPTRCGFITGRYPHRLPIGLEEPLDDADMKTGIPEDHPTIASLVKGNGYETALIGKWHLGNLPRFGPNRHGFDEFFGINGSAADYFTHNNAAGRFDLYEDLGPSKEEGYLTDLFTQHAIRFITRKRSKPFYLSLHYNAPHWPWDGPKDKGAEHDHRVNGRGLPVAGGSLSKYGEMMKSMDAGIGKVLETLKAAQLENTTLVIFTSDNGGERYSFNWPFSFQKGNLWEGGLRVPAIVRWPGIVPAGKVTSQVAVTMDWTATILAVTGTKAHPKYPLDGVDLMDVCAGKRPAFDRTIFWRNAIHDAARMGNWKYLKVNETEHLFDLSSDPGEKEDLRFAHKDVFENLRGQYQAWNSQMLPRKKV
jgi:arylsulfatase A-like enzyme